MTSTTMVSERRLFIARQFDDHQIHTVARLTIRPAAASRYEFAYLRAVDHLPNFEPFLAFPDIEVAYVSDTLFPFFENRVMNTRRPEYPNFLASLNLGLTAEPFEILALSGGHRETDNIEVFPEPERDPVTGLASCLFFARGVRYQAGAFEAIGLLTPGSSVEMVHEPTNANDPSAILILDPATGTRLGYVPRYLTEYVLQARRERDGSTMRASIVRIGSEEAGSHTRLMLEFECCWLDTNWPFSRPDFEPRAHHASVAR